VTRLWLREAWVPESTRSTLPAAARLAACGPVTGEALVHNVRPAPASAMLTADAVAPTIGSILDFVV
jgi:hypothetical protein